MIIEIDGMYLNKVIPVTEVEQLEQAIKALEAQRASLGDAVVDAALGPLREKLHIAHPSWERECRLSL